MHEDEENEQRRRDEMDGARRLPAAEQFERAGNAAFMPGDIVRPVRIDERQQHEDRRRDRRASAARCSASPPRPSGSAGAVVADRAADPAQLRCRSARGRARMPADEAVAEIDEAVDDEEPGEEEMPAPARWRDPGSSGASSRRESRAPSTPSVGRRTGRARRSCRTSRSKICVIADRLARPRRRGRHREDTGASKFEICAPIERRMRVEDLQAAHQQHGCRARSPSASRARSASADEWSCSVYSPAPDPPSVRSYRVVTTPILRSNTSGGTAHEDVNDLRAAHCSHGRRVQRPSCSGSSSRAWPPPGRQARSGRIVGRAPEGLPEATPK